MKRLFDKGIYVEGIRQTKLAGIIFTSIMMLWSVFYPLNEVLSSHKYGDRGVRLISGGSFNPLLMMCFFIYIPVMGIILFSFLFKRNSSDFFHSLPHKRETIYCSYTLSILTWLTVTIFTCVLVEMVISLFGVAYVRLDMASILGYVFNVFSASIMVLGAGLLAVSVTGSVFSSLVAALLIVFFPTTIKMMTVKTVGEMTMVLYNMEVVTIDAFIPIDAFKNSYSSGNIMVGISNSLWCLVLGIVYIALGGILFRSRKSEIAKLPAASENLQQIIRVAVTMVIALFACSEYLTEQSSVGTIILICIALLLYFIYEIVSTKKLGSIKSSLPGLIVLAASCVIFIVGMQTVKKVVLSKEWDAVKIENVVFNEGLASFWNEQKGYQDFVIGELELEHPKVKEKVVQILNRNQADIRNPDSSWDDNVYNLYRYIPVSVKERDSGRRKYRKLWMSEEEFSELQSMLFDTEDFTESIKRFPDKPQSLFLSISGAVLEGDDLLEIYDIYREELEEINTAEMYLRAFNYRYNSENWRAQNTNVIFSYNGFYKDKLYGNYFHIDTATPKTLEIIYEKVNYRRRKEKEAAWERFVKNKGFTETDEMISLVFEIYGGGAASDIISFYLDEDSQDTYDLVEPLINYCGDEIRNGVKEVDLTKPRVYVLFNKRIDENYVGGTECMVIQLDDDMYKELSNAYLM